MKNIIGILLVAVLVFGFSNQASAQDLAQKVKESMKMLKDKTAALGAAKLEQGSLLFGSTEINGDYEIVDEVAEAMGGKGTATLFMKKGDGYERISTNVIKEGRRAVGTLLAANGAAFPLINKGESYYGPADILGFQYETGYEPIKDASGAVIGVYYVGFKQ